MDRHNLRNRSRSYGWSVPLCFVVAITLLMAGRAAALPWGLPIDVNDKNTEVAFEIDSTWHVIHGKTSSLSGKVWLEREDEFNSVRAELSFPVKQFNTDNDSRDERMREVMLEPQFPAVIFKVTEITGLCAPSELASKGICQALLKGKLKILAVEKDFDIPVQLTHVGNEVIVTGNSAFDWSTFGVEDPSIIVARLYKTITVTFKLYLPSMP